MEILTQHNSYPGLTSNKGGKGRVVNLLAKQCRKTDMIAKQEQMANKADLSAHGKPNPCGHPTCRFVGKTAGCTDSRLTLPKLHLPTFNSPYLRLNNYWLF